jgi:hypothetical protein
MSTPLQHQRRFTNYDLGFGVRPKLRLCRVQEILLQKRVLDPPPSRRNLINLLEEGVIDGKLTSYGWVVYEDSFLRWLKAFD